MTWTKPRSIAFVFIIISSWFAQGCGDSGSSQGGAGGATNGSGGTSVQGGVESHGGSSPAQGGKSAQGGTSQGGSVTSQGGSVTSQGGSVTSQGGSASGGSSNGASIGFYTDLASAPVGAFVTAYGSGFGSAGTVTLGGVAQSIVSYSDAKVVFTVSGTGGELVVASHSLGTLPVHTGRVREATASNFAGVWSSVMPGDVIYLRAGTYAQIYGEGDWFTDCTLETYRQGTAAEPIAVAGYPGEAVTWNGAGRHPPICLGDANSSGRRAAFLTFANFAIAAPTACIDTGGDTSDPSGGPDETGATNLRFVGIRCEITDISENTETGMLSIQGDGTKVLGNTFVNDPRRAIINNNHGIYIQNGADDVEVAYNVMDGLRMGHVIQIHQDGAPKLYERVSVHDNYLHGLDYGDMRGISVVNVADTSTIEIARNVFRHQGQDGWGCINIYRGVVTVDSNDCRDSQGGVNLNGGYDGARQVTLTGNAICPVSGYPAIGVEGGASMSEYTLLSSAACK